MDINSPTPWEIEFKKTLAVPGVRGVVKKDMKVAGFTLPIPLFIGTWIFIDDAYWGTDNGAGVLRHERHHAVLAHRMTRFLFLLAYAILPAGLSFRALIELYAYKESVRARVEYLGYCSDADIDYWVAGFENARYWWMAPMFAGKVRASLEAVRVEAYATRKAKLG